MKINLEENGELCWYNNDDQLHREGGPACICKDGSMHWIVKSRLHRDDGGPAVLWEDGNAEWWVYGRRIAIVKK